MTWLILFPILIPLITAITVLFAWHKLILQRWLTLIGCGGLLISSIALFNYTLASSYLVANIGNWPAPYGISLVSDTLSSTLILMEAIVAFCIAIYSFADMNKSSCKAGFYPAYCILLMGLSGSFLTGDLFNLYVWFEVTLISSFVLLTLYADNAQLESGVKYAVLNLIATLILLTAIIFLYGMTGTLNMADLAIHIRDLPRTGLITTIATIFIIAFGMKAALFPLFFWLPASYHTPSFSTSAIFAALLTKVGVYALLRTFTLLFLRDPDYIHCVLLIMALLTLVIGIFAALAQVEIRRVLSFSLISHVGYMILGLALFTSLALIGSIFYLIQHILVIAQLFLSSGVIRLFSGNTLLKESGGLYQRYPFFSLFFLITALSLAGIPPSSAFWPKLILLEASFQSHHYFTLFIILLVNIMTLYIIARLWQTQFLQEPLPPEYLAKITISKKVCMLLPVALLTVMILAIGLMPMPVFHLSQLASDQLLHPDGYIHAVLGGGDIVA